MSSYPTTAEEWWASVDANRDSLRSIVLNYHPGGARTGPKLPITAGNAEAVCSIFREEIAAETVGDPVASFDKALAERDAQPLIEILNQTWFGVPESIGAHSIPGFHELCDLCSESHVVTPELEE